MKHNVKKQNEQDVKQDVKPKSLFQSRITMIAFLSVIIVSVNISPFVDALVYQQPGTIARTLITIVGSLMCMRLTLLLGDE